MEVYWAHAKQLLDLDLKIRFENKTQGTEGMAQQLRVHIALLRTTLVLSAHGSWLTTTSSGLHRNVKGSGSTVSLFHKFTIFIIFTP